MSPWNGRLRINPRTHQASLILLVAGSLALAAVGIAPAPARGQTLEPVDFEPSAVLPNRMEDGEEIELYSATFAPATDNGFYGLWFEVRTGEHSPGHLMGHRFDGGDLPIGALRSINTFNSGPLQRYLQVRRAGDHMLVVWKRGTSTSPNLLGRILDAQGKPLSPILPIGDTSYSIPTGMALFASGRALMVWTDTGLAAHRLAARTIDPDGTLGTVRYLTSSPAGRPVLGVDEKERVLLVWYDGVLRGRWLDANGRPTSTPFLVTEEPSTSSSLVVWPDGLSSVVWSTCSDLSRRNDCEVHLRRFDDEGTPLGPPVRLSPADGASHLQPVTTITPDEQQFVSWQACPAVPGQIYLNCRFYAVALDRDGELLATAPPVEFIGEPVDRQVVTLDDDILVYWYAYNFHPEGNLVQRYRFTPAPPPGDPPPPDGVAPLTSAEYPDFRFWVQIGEEGSAIHGAMEPLCIPETLCVSGALPGRSEVFLRVVGPRANGYLWPTLVKFTTSRVAVWIEQVSTGTVRYYVLEGASPGSSDLPGLFDREGFPL